MIIRSAVIEDAAGLANVRISGWKGAYRGIVPDSVLDGMDIHQEIARWRDNINNHTPERFLFIAEMDGQVVGFCGGGPDRDQDPIYSGEIYALYVHPDQQRCGVGWALAQAGMDWLQQQGYAKMLIWVLRDNLPARRFYEALSGLVVHERDIEIGGVHLPELGYGFTI